MKKLLLSIIGLLTLTTAVFGQGVIVGSSTLAGVYLLSTNRASVYSIQIAVPSATAIPVTVTLYDTDRTNAPIWGTNYTNLAMIQRVTTNGTYVTNFIGQNGVTNWYTNVGVLTWTSTLAAATSQLPAMASMVVNAGQTILFDTDLLFARGISMVANSNATVILNYKTGQ